MSFLDNRERQFNWLAAPATSSWLVTAGCAQCGRTLDASDFADDNLSGKCLICCGFVPDDADVLDELEG